MNISFQKLLMKMEDELRLAKKADTEAAQRERIHSIKTLCELVLDEPVQQGAGAAGYSSPDTSRNIVQPASLQSLAANQAFTQQPQMPVNQPSPMMPQPKKIEMDDNSNGDSLFDF
ncbi:YwdI family protein [Bacillus sp. JJ1122]|uniref:YwdI family protein n=1 Tax=Bacillus sp. JJ1122 TaxID=3122951 RepID=UPI002FFED125